MSYYRIPSGSNLILNVLLDDGNPNKFPRAHLFNSNLTEVVGSPVPLTHVAYGYYSNLSVSLPDGKYMVVYIVYDDAGYTQPSVRYSRSLDVFDVNDIVDVNAISQGVWRETRADNSPTGSFGEILDVALSSIKTDSTPVPAVFSGVNELLLRLTSQRAGYLDNINVPMPTNSSIASAVWDAQASNHTEVGSFGSNLDIPISTREPEATAFARFDALASNQATAISELAVVGDGVTAIKSKTDQLSFQSGLVRAQSEVVSDKTGYGLSPTALVEIGQAIWDVPMTNHLIAGSTGAKLNSGDALTDIPAIASAVWNTTRGSHSTSGSFGEALQGVLTPDRATKLENLDVPVSSRESEVAAASRHLDNNFEHDTTQASLTVLTDIVGIPVGSSISEDLAVVSSNSATAVSRIGVPTLSSLSDDVAGVRGVVDTVSTKATSTLATLGSPFGASLSADIQAVNLTTLASKSVTDKFTFSGSNVNSNVKTNEDKAGYTLTSGEKNTIVSQVWDSAAASYSTPGSFGETIQYIAIGSNTAAIAAAVWDTPTTLHTSAGTFGLLASVVDETTKTTLEDLVDGTTGLAALKNEVINQGGLTRAEVNQNETKIDAIIPALAASQAAIVTQVDNNETKIDMIIPTVTAARDAVIVQINQNEVKIDALQGNVSSLTNNTTVRLIVPERMIRPSTGSKLYEFHLRLFDENGAPLAPDTTPVVRIRRLDTGTDVVTGAAMTQDGVKIGAYMYAYTLLTSTFTAPILVEVTVVSGGVTRYIPATSEITEFESDLTSVETQLSIVEGKVDLSNATLSNGVYGLASIRAKQDEIITEIDSNESSILAIKSKVDELPTTISTSADINDVLSAVNSKPSLPDITSVVNAARDNIKGPDGRNITETYDNMDLSSVVKTNDPRFNNLDVPVSSRSTLTATQVWTNPSRDLTNYSLSPASVKSVWDYLASQAIVPGSLGKLLVDNLDVNVGSRATHAQVSTALTGVAQESTVSSLQSLISTEGNENQLLLNQLISSMAGVSSKVSNLPVDPASQSAVLSAISGITAPLADVSARTSAIKAKTDALPIDPAREASVTQIPTNPLLATDVRLNKLANLDAPVSSVVPADISNLATKTDVSTGNIVLSNQLTAQQAALTDLQMRTAQIKSKTDIIPTMPASLQHVNDARDVVMHELTVRGPELTPAAVWSFPVREITNNLSDVGPDISGLAEKTDLAVLAKTQYVNRMSTTFNASTGEQELIVWAEKDGISAASSECVVEIYDQTNTIVWNAAQALPYPSGVYRFSYQWQPLSGRNYYVQISTVVDGQVRKNTQSFYTY